MPQIAGLQAIEWKEAITTGIDVIDNEHHYLLEILQEINEKLLVDDSDLLLEQAIKNLLCYALMHFETEEALMQRYSYAAAYPDEAQDHIIQHRKFSHRIVTVHDQLREGQKISRIEIVGFLNNWLQDHVFDRDKSLCIFLVQKMGK
ncbi:MAG: bacteriohemerythrin [Candidatus Thiodiazotropha sp. 6PLUC2]